MIPRRECPVCHGAGEVQYSTTPSIDHRDPRHETREDPCGECNGTGEVRACFYDPALRVHPPLACLMAIPGEREAVEARASRLVAEARVQGASWAQVGAALRISKQAAHERYGGLV